VQLGYAETSHANQGRTVDRSFLYFDGPTDCRGIYVPLTRGRDTNEAFVVLNGDETPADLLADALGRGWIDQPALQVQAEMRRTTGDGPVDGQQFELRLLNRSELRELIRRKSEVSRQLDAIRLERRNAAADVRSIEGEQARIARTLDDDRARLSQARSMIEEHDRPFHRRKHRVELDAAHALVDRLPRTIAASEAELVRLERRLHQAAQRVVAAENLDKRTPQLMAEHTMIEHQLGRDVESRGRRLANDPPARILEHLGPFPANTKHESLWIDAVGKIAQHNTALDARRPGHAPDTVSVDDVAFDMSRRTAKQALDRLDHSIKQEQLAIEPPGRELGLSL